MGRSGDVEVSINRVSQGTFRPTGMIAVYGGAGDDDIQVANRIDNRAWLDGGGGDDCLRGASGDDVLLGGDGDDILVGRAGRDLLIGGLGSDVLVGNRDEDILIAGRTAFDGDAEALAAVMAEWTSEGRYADRVAHVRGEASGAGRNGGYFLRADGPDATVFDDVERQLLDVLAQAQASWLYWMGMLSTRTMMESTANKRLRDEHGCWQPPRVTDAEALEQAAAMADRFNRIFLRTLRALRDLRRYAGPVIVQNAGQVNVAGQQVNVGG